MVETSIISVLCRREAWAKYSSVLDWAQLRAQTPEVHKILLTVQQWHKEQTTDLTLAELPVWFYLQYTGLSDKQKEIYNAYFSATKEAEVRDELIIDYLNQLHDTQVRRNVALMAMDSTISNDKVVEQVQLLNTTRSITDATDFVTTDLDALMQDAEDVPGYTWRLDCLNKSVGPIRRGMFGVILARVETGKTAMWVSEVAHFVRQLKDGEDVCVFFNEENGTDVMWRLYSAICQATMEQLQTQPEREPKRFLHEEEGIKYAL